MNLQPIRVQAGWYISYNQFYEVDPKLGFEHYFDGSSLMMLQNDARLKLIDIQWRPEADINGNFELKVLNYLENFNPKTYEFEIDPDWENPFLIFCTNDRLKLVEKLEELMRTLPVYRDQRITKTRGVVDKVSESYRLEINEKGITKQLVKKILENGSAKIQFYVLNHKEITRDIILYFAQKGITKQVKNTALNKIKSKPFKT